MEKQYPAYEFEAEILKGGYLRIPPSTARKLKTGTTVTIRLSAGAPGEILKRKRVTEAEIERISRMQLEQRDNVVLALRAEGILAASKTFRAAVRALLGGGT